MEISTVSISSLVLIILFLLLLLIIEIKLHLNSLSKIPIRIHVNGARGKSSVVRLIAAGLRSGGFKTFAKTTGTIPRIINEKGEDVELHRLRSASIGEQIKLIRYFGKQIPEALVIECMAVNPQYQWISEHRIIRSTLCVITNVRKDHVDEMGVSNKEIAYSLSNTIPYNSKVITSEQKFSSQFNNVANKRNSSLIITKNNDVDNDYLKKFPYLEHPENISLALKVCQEYGISKKIALDGMLKTNPDPGVLFIWNLKKSNQFISAFAANDPDSTYKVWKLIRSRIDNKKVCFFLNSRDDRRYRTVQLLNLVLTRINPDLFIIRGNNIQNLISKYNSKSSIKLFPMKTTPNEVIDNMMKYENYAFIGIGNIVGWGEEFVSKLNKLKL
ncbi:poly-gamma-glutamate synthase PgsB [Candidatus Marinimicrobia bacterium]|nr:poly-gamma-glutamate synthase PgsB [Candidatus Neomarinimicrobiota bacterium]